MENILPKKCIRMNFTVFDDWFKWFRQCEKLKNWNLWTLTIKGELRYSYILKPFFMQSHYLISAPYIVERKCFRDPLQDLLKLGAVMAKHMDLVSCSWLFDCIAWLRWTPDIADVLCQSWSGGRPVRCQCKVMHIDFSTFRFQMQHFCYDKNNFWAAQGVQLSSESLLLYWKDPVKGETEV